MSAYESKFEKFAAMCEQMGPDDVLVIPEPEVLGDTREEMVESLNRLAESEARLSIVPERMRTEAV
jgi:hypothetical protein